MIETGNDMKINTRIKDFCLYAVVGLTSTFVEWLVFYLLNRKIVIHYTIATAVAYFISTFVNWVLGRYLVFREHNTPVIRELLGVYTASIVGLLLNEGIMLLAIDCFGVENMVAKVIASTLVFTYNYTVKRYVIYRKK